MRKRAARLAWFLLPLILAPAYCVAKDYLTITSDPPGAKVEIDGDIVGKTPYTIEILGSICMAREMSSA